MSRSFLVNEDYQEPRCPFTRPGDIESIPVRRVLEKLDEYMADSDFSGAERHLDYWLAEAEYQGDYRGKLTVLNEQIGLYRKSSQTEKGLNAVKAALSLARTLQMDDNIVMGTTLINAATAYRAFDMPSEALPLYQEAKRLYESLLDPEDPKMGGLYNNMALTEEALCRYDEAETHFFQALSVMTDTEGGELEAAITYCNLADLTYVSYPDPLRSSLIAEYLEKAKDLLLTSSVPRNGYFRYVCDKCASAFAFFNDDATYHILDELSKAKGDA